MREKFGNPWNTPTKYIADMPLFTQVKAGLQSGPINDTLIGKIRASQMHFALHI